MLQFSRGQKQKLGDLTPSLTIETELAAQGAGLVFDFSCFGVDAGEKLSDDRYFVFYNQKNSPNNEIVMQGDNRFVVDLAKLPATLKKLVFVITIDGAGTLSQLSSGHFQLAANGSPIAKFSFVGADFSTEKAIIAAEIYLKDVWRVAAVGQGFAGGLGALLKHFGGEAIEDATPAAPPVAAPAAPRPVAPPPAPVATPVAQPKISLDKDKELQIKLEKSAPQLVNLSKTLAVSLKKQGLQDITARVALVLDASGSMTYQYSSGAVQLVVDRIATLAMRLDDDGELDTWGFASRHSSLPAVTLDNVNGYVKQVTHKSSFMSTIGKLGVGNNEPPVMREILDFYRSSTLPAFVVFISDGGVGSSDEIKKVLIEASSFPIFWQFVGLGGSSYGILEDLDTMRGRVIDNANFFHVDDIRHISDETLYNRLLNEFPEWLRNAKGMGILR
jgi:stress response protein SCP2